MKKKEVLKRLSAVSMAAMMTVTMIPSNAYAADELFSDVEVETSTDAEDEDSTEVAASDADDILQMRMLKWKQKMTMRMSM